MKRFKILALVIGIPLLASGILIFISSFFMPPWAFFTPSDDNTPVVAPSPTEAPKAHFTKTVFLSLKSGMPYKKVVSMLHTEGDLVSSNTLGNLTTENYNFTDDEDHTINLFFQNGRLISKTAFNLPKE